MPPMATTSTPSASRSRPWRSASVHRATRSLFPSTSTTARSELIPPLGGSASPRVNRVSRGPGVSPRSSGRCRGTSRRSCPRPTRRSGRGCPANAGSLSRRLWSWRAGDREGVAGPERPASERACALVVEVPDRHVEHAAGLGVPGLTSTVIDRPSRCMWPATARIVPACVTGRVQLCVGPGVDRAAQQLQPADGRAGPSPNRGITSATARVAVAERPGAPGAARQLDRARAAARCPAAAARRVGADSAARTALWSGRSPASRL